MQNSEFAFFSIDVLTKIYKYGIVTNYIHIFPFDDGVFASAEEAEEFQFSIYDDGNYTSVREIDFYITHESDSCTAFDVDNFFFSEI